MSEKLEKNPGLENCLTNVGLLADMLQRNYLPVKLGAAMSDAEELPTLPDDFLKDAVFYRVNAVRFRERKDIRYAVSSLLAALHQLSVPVFFIVRGTRAGIDIYLGIHEAPGESRERDNDEVKSALRGFLPGTEPELCSDAARNQLADGLNGLSCAAALMGVPSEKTLFAEDKRNGPMEYGLERLVDAMTPQDYALVICATPVSQIGASTYYKHVSSVLDMVHPLVKVSDQHSIGKNWTDSVQNGTSQNKTITDGQSGSESHGESYKIKKTDGKDDKWWTAFKKSFNVWWNGGKTAYPQQSDTTTKGWQHSESTSFGTTFSESHSTGGSSSDAQTLEHINSMATYVEDVLKLLQERLKNGMGEGLWKSAVLMLGADRETAQKGAHMLAGIWSGGKSHQDPVRYIMLTDHEKMRGVAKPFLTALPLASLDFLRDHPLGDAYHSAATWLSSADLAHEMNLPHYALPDLAVEKVVEYGRFMPKPKKQSMLKLGEMIDHNVKTDVPVWLDLKKLNRHLFVTGLTGSGKSNTIRAILVELARQDIPFMVIEPAKKEYRSLKKRILQMHENGETRFEDMDVYSLSDVGPLWESISQNPFDFDVPANGNPGTALVSHIDRLKSVFNSALGMYSSMPFILEDIIYKAYTNMGWDIETGRNIHLQKVLDSYERENRRIMERKLRPLFLPVLSDLKPLVQPALKSFFGDKSDYSISLRGALRSRLDSLTRGNKGAMLDSRISTPLQRRHHQGGMLRRPCVIELESFADNEEKAFIMALLLSRIYEYRIACHDGAISDKLKHVLVIEEAHRLLSQPQKGGEHTADGKGKSVEVFSDMLAEIRAYGQGIIIADQIPAKLIPDVMKNTDVKIVHRLTAKDDREAVGAAMNLTKEQMEDLSKSIPGMATISYGGMDKAARVMMTEIKAAEEDALPNESNHDMEAYRRDMFTWYDISNDTAERTTFKDKDFASASRGLAALLAHFAQRRGNMAADCWGTFANMLLCEVWDYHEECLLRAITEDIHRWMELLQRDAAKKEQNAEVEEQGTKRPGKQAAFTAQVSTMACAMAQAAIIAAETARQEYPDDFTPLETALERLGTLLREPRADQAATDDTETLYGAMIRIMRENSGAGGEALVNILIGLGGISANDDAWELKGQAGIEDILVLHPHLENALQGKAAEVVDELLQTTFNASSAQERLCRVRDLLGDEAYRAIGALPAAARIRSGIGAFHSREEWEQRLCAHLAAETPYPINPEKALPYASRLLARVPQMATTETEISILGDIRNS